ncbi:MAG: sucrose phosphorylase [Deltaproteobacteria bacterium]|nr:sucrose phosphorylase [Deltaproteobacteria bacterium]
MPIKNGVQLITYPDSLGRNLPELHYTLKKYLHDAISGIHLLPFYPSSADRGFSPITYEKVDPHFGSWTDIDRIGREYDLIIDFMVNHISRQSIYFQDYLKNGSRSPYADMFLSFDKLAPNGNVTQEDLEKVYTRKPSPPYMTIERADGTKEKIWSTFDNEQIDLDWQSPVTRKIMRKFLIQLAGGNIGMIRLDAFAYTTIKIGTRSFFLEPDVWELLDWLDDCVSPFQVEILPEVHEHYSYQIKMSEKGYWVYDFALPMLVIHTLYHHSNKCLINWLHICPRKQITTLDTHDGIGIVDVHELMSQDEIHRTLQELYDKGSNAKRHYNNAKYNNLDIYQMNTTYYSALECNDDSYICARIIQFFAPGIPQVYYVGLLAGKNDIELVEKTKSGRNINRHNYGVDEIDLEMKKPIVKRLIRLMQFRNNYPAFDGEFHVEDSPENQVVLKWNNGVFHAKARIDLDNYDNQVVYYDNETHHNKTVTF